MMVITLYIWLEQNPHIIRGFPLSLDALWAKIMLRASFRCLTKGSLDMQSGLAALLHVFRLLFSFLLLSSDGLGPLPRESGGPPSSSVVSFFLLNNFFFY